ncbi:hypothetical protein ACLBYD_27440 [Rhodococcus sp. C26F]
MGDEHADLESTLEVVTSTAVKLIPGGGTFAERWIEGEASVRRKNIDRTRFVKQVTYFLRDGGYSSVSVGSQISVQKVRATRDE